MSGFAPLTRFGVIRHAETRWNREGKIQGQWDSPLTGNGRQQAADWGRRLGKIPWCGMLVSTLPRALHTAGRINTALGLPVVADARLREQHWGEWTGSTTAQIRREHARAYQQQAAVPWEFRPPGGESRMEVCRRSFQALAEGAGIWPGGPILVVAHEGVLKCLVYRVNEEQSVPLAPERMEPGFLHWIVHDGCRLRVEKINAFSLTK